LKVLHVQGCYQRVKIGTLSLIDAIHVIAKSYNHLIDNEQLLKKVKNTDLKFFFKGRNWLNSAKQCLSVNERLIK